MKIVAVADEDTVTGLRLAGIDEGYCIQSPEQSLEDTKSILLTLSERKDIGLIITTERIADALRPVIAEITEKEFPIVVEIQDKYGPSTREIDPIKSLVKRAVDVDL